MIPDIIVGVILTLVLILLSIWRWTSVRDNLRKRAEHKAEYRIPEWAPFLLFILTFLTPFYWCLGPMRWYINTPWAVLIIPFTAITVLVTVLNLFGMRYVHNLHPYSR
jgi:uncharacterized membrane protein